jgi:hypothetical protein
MPTDSRSDLFSKEKVDQILAKQTGDVREFVWTFPAYQHPLKVTIQLAPGQQGVRPKTVTTLNELGQLGVEQRSKIRHLLYEDATMYRGAAAYGDPDVPRVPIKASLWKRLIGSAPAYEFVAIAPEDPRHPCNFTGGVEGVDAKVSYEGFEIQEDDGCQNRLCFLHCTPQWEEEHGRRIVIRNGEPVALSEFPEGLNAYDGI